MTDTETTYIAIRITARDGIVVERSADDEPGSYMGLDSPDWLAGWPNHFVGNSLREAQDLALNHVADVLEEVTDTFESLEALGR